MSIKNCEAVVSNNLKSTLNLNDFVSSLHWCFLGFLSFLFIHCSIFPLWVSRALPHSYCLLLHHSISRIIHFSKFNFYAAAVAAHTKKPPRNKRLYINWQCKKGNQKICVLITSIKNFVIEITHPITISILCHYKSIHT